MRTPCPQCHKQQLTIQPATDSYYKEVYCYSCGYNTPLKNFNSLRKAQDNPRLSGANKKPSNMCKDIILICKKCGCKNYRLLTDKELKTLETITCGGCDETQPLPAYTLVKTDRTPKKARANK